MFSERNSAAARSCYKYTKLSTFQSFYFIGCLPKLEESAVPPSKSPMDSVEFDVKLSSQMTASSMPGMLRWFIKPVDTLQCVHGVEDEFCVYCVQFCHQSIEIKYQNCPTL